MSDFEPRSLPDARADSAVKVFDVLDPTAAREGFDALDQEVVHLDSGRFRARRVMVRLVSCQVLFQRANVRLRSRTVVHEDLVACMVTAPTARGTVNGLPTSPELLVVGGPGAVAVLVVEPRYRSITVLIPPAKIQEHLERRGRAGEFRVPSGVELRQAPPSGVRHLYELCRRLVHKAVRCPALFAASAEVRAGAYAEVIETLFETFTSSSVLRPSRHDRTRQNYGRILRLAEKSVLASDSARVCVSDLCDAAAVSERTLQTACQQTFGMSPVAFLKRVRLHGARRDLREAPRRTTVAAVAVRWGFWHFGEFSVGYKTLFGVSPSETLRGGRSA